MKCLNCGKKTTGYLCPDCLTEEILDSLVPQMLSYKAEQCTYPYLMEYVATLSEERNVRKCIPEILAQFPAEVAEYYYCIYYRYEAKDKLESAIETYLSKHDWQEEKSQRLIRYLLDYYIPNDFIKPRAWCDWIAKVDGVSCELYVVAAKYYAMIAEYDLADKMADKGLACDRFLYSTKEYMQTSLEKQKADTLRYNQRPVLA